MKWNREFIWINGSSKVTFLPNESDVCWNSPSIGKLSPLKFTPFIFIPAFCPRERSSFWRVPWGWTDVFKAGSHTCAPADRLDRRVWAGVRNVPATDHTVHTLHALQCQSSDRPARGCALTFFIDDHRISDGRWHSAQLLEPRPQWHLGFCGSIAHLLPWHHNPHPPPRWRGIWNSSTDFPNTSGCITYSKPDLGHLLEI